MVGQRGLELGDLVVEFGDDVDRRAGGSPEGTGDRLGCGQVGCVVRLGYCGPGRRYCVDALQLWRRAVLRQTQPGALVGRRRTAQNRQRVTFGERIERRQGRRVVLAQCATQHVGVPYPRPNQALMRACQYFNRLGVGAVPGDRPVVVPISPYQIGEQLGVRGIRFRPRDVVAGGVRWSV